LLRFRKILEEINFKIQKKLRRSVSSFS